MYDRKKILSAQNVTDVSFFVVFILARLDHDVVDIGLRVPPQLRP